MGYRDIHNLQRKVKEDNKPRDELLLAMPCGEQQGRKDSSQRHGNIIFGNLAAASRFTISKPGSVF